MKHLKGSDNTIPSCSEPLSLRDPVLIPLTGSCEGQDGGTIRIGKLREPVPSRPERAVGSH
ncbi:MAG: hypothetical protein QME51_07830, partial [Planctomycetota bacterium]|nr:hypothetical protein [Planctomycetota bacterium]